MTETKVAREGEDDEDDLAFFCPPFAGQSLLVGT